MTGSFIWYELMTDDPKGSKAFYDSVVGWDIEDEGQKMPTGTTYHMIKRDDGGNAGGMLTLNDEMKANGARPVWLGYLHTADVNATVAAIEADGGKAMMPAMDLPVGRIAMVTDPSGAPFYVMNPIPPEGQPDAASDVFSVDQPQHVRWNELSSDDQDGAIDFYTKHFGWTQDGAMPMGDMGDYKFIQNDGVAIGAIMRRPSQRPVSLWLYYFGVDDIDRAAGAVTDGGGQILFGPSEIPGGEFSIVGMDPQGAPFGLVGPRRA